MGWDFEMEFLRLFAHGVTHLADYHHQTESDEKKMLAKEEEILAQIAISPKGNSFNNSIFWLFFCRFVLPRQNISSLIYLAKRKI